MTTPRVPPFSEWAFTTGFLIVGLLFLWVGVGKYLRGLPPEEGLLLVEGMPADEREEVAGKTSILYFNIAGHEIHYADDRPRYKAVVNAVAREPVLRVWILKEGDVRFTAERGQLCKMAVGEQTILPYADTLAAEAKTLWLMLGGAAVTAGIGIMGLYIAARDLRAHRAVEAGSPPPETSPAELADQHERMRWCAGWGLSLVLYAIVVYPPLHGEAEMMRLVQMLGERPWGVHPYLAYLAIMTLLYLPVPWLVWRGMDIADQARMDGRLVDLGYLLTVGTEHPKLRVAQIGCFLGLAYFILLVVALAIYTRSRGL